MFFSVDSIPVKTVEKKPKKSINWEDKPSYAEVAVVEMGVKVKKVKGESVRQSFDGQMQYLIYLACTKKEKNTSKSHI